MSRQQKDRRQNAAGQIHTNELQTDIESLRDLDIKGLRSLWKVRVGNEPPNNRSAHLLRRLLAWQIQVRAFGNLNSVTARKLRAIATTLERDGTYEPKTRRDLSLGVVLTREWKGTIHKVTVMEGGFQYLDKRYGSLSDIARTITGTRWSGPRFFGLEQKKSPKQEVVAQ